MPALHDFFSQNQRRVLSVTWYVTDSLTRPFSVVSRTVGTTSSEQNKRSIEDRETRPEHRNLITGQHYYKGSV